MDDFLQLGLVAAMSMTLAKIAAALVLLAALFFGEQYIEGRGYARAVAENEAAINKQKVAAVGLLLSETQRANAIERRLQNLKNIQEQKDATHQKTVADLSERLRSLSGPAGRLRDPNAPGCGRGGGGTAGEATAPPGDRPTDQPEAGGLLSADLSGLLQRLTREADEINSAYLSCRADAFAVRGAQP